MPIEGGGAGDKQPSSDSKGQHPSHHNTGNIPTLTSETQQSPISHQQNLPSITTTPPSEVSKSIGPEQSSIQQSTADTTGHQVIAVSASKGPAAFFNLAKKFLAIDEYCDLSALEGAIVSAVDAAHLLERSKIANIVRYDTMVIICFLFCFDFCLSSSNITYIIFYVSFLLVESKPLMFQLNPNENHSKKYQVIQVSEQPQVTLQLRHLNLNQMNIQVSQTKYI